MKCFSLSSLYKPKPRQQWVQPSAANTNKRPARIRCPVEISSAETQQIALIQVHYYIISTGAAFIGNDRRAHELETTAEETAGVFADQGRKEGLSGNC